MNPEEPLELREADVLFLDILQTGIDKKARLQPKSLEILGVEHPEMLDDLEGQVSSAKMPPKEPPSAEPEPLPEESSSAEPEPLPEELPSDEPEPEPEELPSAEPELPAKEPISEESLPEMVTKEPLELPTDFLKKPIHPLQLAAVLKYTYNDAWVEWFPETLWAILRRDIGAISKLNKDKIQAISVALKTDAPWVEWSTFENVGRAFNETTPIFGELQPLSPAEAAFTRHILEKLQPTVEFSGEVLGYIAAVCLYNGIVYAPPALLGEVQEIINKQSANPELADVIKKAWTALRGKDLSSVDFNDDNVIDVQIAKLWAIREYLNEKQTTLKEA